MRFIISVIFFCTTLVSMSPTYSALRVLTTTQDLAAIAEAVGGSHIEVQSLTRGTRDPHFAQAKPSMIRKVYDADLLLLIGADLEVGWLSALLKSSRNREVLPGNSGYLDLSIRISLLGKPTGPVTRDMGDVHVQGNPHYWLDPNNGRLMAQAIAERLVMHDPENRNAYFHNLSIFEKHLTEKMREWQTMLAPLKGQKVIAYHASLIYLANYFNFEIVDEVEPKPGISPSAAHLNSLINRIENTQIKLLIMEPFYEKRSVNYLRNKTGIHIAVIPQSVGSQKHIKDYIQLFDEIVSVLKQVEEF